MAEKLSPEGQKYDVNGDGKLTGAEVTEYTNAVSGSTQLVGGSGNPTSKTTVSTEVTRLNYQSAKDLLQKSIDALEVNVKFTKDDIKAFMALFEAEQNKSIAKTITTTGSTTTPGTGEKPVDVTAASNKTTEYPSFFNPSTFAQDFIWSKVNFADEDTLGGKALGVLNEARAAVEAFQLMGVSDRDVRNAAKQIAMGKKTIASYKTELQQVAKREYPQFADRFDADPELTTYDIASPIIGMLAKTWEVDAKSIKMDDPIVMSYMNYAGPDGKGQQPSRYDLLLKARKDPKYQYTQEANENARSAATELARAFGFGI